MNQMLKRVSALAAALALTLCACAGAETLFEGVVTSSGATPVLAAFGAAVDQMNVSPGDRVEKGQTVAQLRTTRVYAPCEGTVSGVFGAEGDLTDGVNQRYGAVLYVEPLGKYTVAATTEKAYNISENRFVHIGDHLAGGAVGHDGADRHLQRDVRSLAPVQVRAFPAGAVLRLVVTVVDQRLQALFAVRRLEDHVAAGAAVAAVRAAARNEFLAVEAAAAVAAVPRLHGNGSLIHKHGSISLS